MKQIAEDFILRDDLCDVDLSPLKQAVLPPIPEEGGTGTDSDDLNAAGVNPLKPGVSEPLPVKNNAEAPIPEENASEANFNDLYSSAIYYGEVEK